MFELIFTSLPRGLFPGKSGFSTVAMTQGMPPNLIAPLENLSGYNFTYKDNQLLPELNPVCCYYIKMRYGNQNLYIAGRVAPNGLDYSRRNNKIAHHITLESADELVSPDGAAGLFTTGSIDSSSTHINGGNFVNDFQRDPCELPYRELSAGSAPATLQARTWENLTGDAAAAAWIADKFKYNPNEPVYVKYDPSIDVQTLLSLVREVCLLLDENSKKFFTFSTYFNNASPGTDCFLRFIPAFSQLLPTLVRFQSNSLIELGKAFPAELIDSISSSELVATARTGKKPVIKTIPVIPSAAVSEAQTAPEMPDMPEKPDMPEMPNAPLSIRVQPTGSMPPSAPYNHSMPFQPSAQRQYTRTNNNNNNSIKNTIMLIVCAVVLIGLGAAAFLCDFSDESSSNESSGINSTKTSSENNKKDTGKSKDAEKGKESEESKENGKNKDNPSNNPPAPQLIITKDGTLASSIKDVKIKLDGKELKEFPKLPCESYNKYIAKLQEAQDIKMQQNKPSWEQVNDSAKDIAEAFDSIKLDKNIEEQLKAIDKLVEQYYKNFSDLISTSNVKKITDNRWKDRRQKDLQEKIHTLEIRFNDAVEKANEQAEKTKNKANEAINKAKNNQTIFYKYKEKWEKKAEECKKLLNQKRKPETIYANEKAAFEKKLGAVLTQIKNDEIKNIIRNYFTVDAEKALPLDEKRLKELAAELNKFIEENNSQQQTHKQQVVRRSPDASAQKKQGK